MIFDKKKLSSNSSQSEGLLRPYQHHVMEKDKGGQPCRYARLVCLSERCYGDRPPLLLVKKKLIPCQCQVSDMDFLSS